MTWTAGTFNRTGGAVAWGDDRDAAVEIAAGLHDTHDEDLAQGINDCLHKGGQNAATADISLGGNKATNMADATVDADGINFGLLAIRQIVVGTSTTDSNNGTTALASTSLSATLTPKFADSRLIIWANAFVSTENVSAGSTTTATATWQIWRSSGGTGVICNASVGRSLAVASSNSAKSFDRLSLMGTEVPGAGAHTYVLRYSSPLAGVQAQFRGSQGTQATMIIAEVRP